jgi:hypothetical protein
MKRSHQPAVRAAILLHQRLVGEPQPDKSISLPYYSWNSVQDLQRKIATARARGWHLAAGRLKKELANALSSCCRLLDSTLGSFTAANHQSRCRVSATDIYRDLVALDDEFGEVEIDLAEHEIAATTEAIVLKDIDLGRFQIRLNWHLLGHTHRPYAVKALDPNPAAKNKNVTHPHVQDEHLCEGEGSSAIAAALAEGRVYDFFLLVSQVLHNYGRGSAYIELSRWHSIPCNGCGNSVNADECFCCYGCEDELCENCCYTCSGCGESFCNGCLGKCPVCEGECCYSCLEPCQRCCGRACPNCREGGKCHRSSDQPHEEPDHDSTENLQGELAAAGA